MSMTKESNFLKLKKKLRPSKYIYSPVIKYAYINVRIGAMKNSLLSAEDMMSLEGAKNLPDFIALLENTHYKSALIGIKDINVRSIDKALIKSLIEFDERMIELVPKDVKLLLAAKSIKYNILNIKSLLTAIDSKIPIDEIAGKLLPKDNKLISDLLGVPAMPEALGMLAKLGYIRAAKLEGYLKTYAKERNLNPIMAEINRNYYETLWAMTEGLSRNDDKIAKKLIGIEIDAMNIMSILRGKWKGYDVRDFIIPGGINIKAKNLLENSADTETVADTVSLISESTYAQILKEGLNFFEEHKSLVQFETGFRRHILDVNKEVMRSGPFNIGTVLGFLKLKEVDIENLRAMTVSISEELPREELNQLII